MKIILKIKSVFLTLSIICILYYILFPSAVIFAASLPCTENGKTGTCKAVCDALEDSTQDLVQCNDITNPSAVNCCISKTTAKTCASPNTCQQTDCPSGQGTSTMEDSWCVNNKKGTYCCKPAPPTTPSPATTAPTGSPAGPLKLQLQIPIGGLSLMIISGSSIGQYIRAVFIFGSAATVALAIVMIMAGGVQWILSGGEPNKIGEAKNTITKALLGMFMALFAVFMLQTVSPGTVTFKPIVTEEIAGMQCCLAGGSYSFLTKAICQSKSGAIVSPTLCASAGAPNPQDIISNECNLKNPRAQCFAEACDKLSPPRIVSAAGGTCDKAKPNCCAETGPVKTCQDNSGCPSIQYCASAGGAGQPGRCFDKRDPGINCTEAVLGDKSWHLLGGGSDDVCKSGKCDNFSAASSNTCVPKDGMGKINDICTKSSQCWPVYFCACQGWKGSSTAEKKDPRCTIGTCQLKASNYTEPVCQGWSADGNDGYACASGCCPRNFLSANTCGVFCTVY